ncbi:hypothetical protein K443DRAFT_91844 [Laccaria amethystina LaAM-08-1]|uniref:Uncharacterized protein n=1 Tax=Laccaria amethystina LaAM-08-1 TaxID=1095629 RepID=A0A0C9YAR0_9AGAR|nr:hypothetical protein K443DRAFT_91844 [Laccaria amethystina LaAM-08-1]
MEGCCRSGYSIQQLVSFPSIETIALRFPCSFCWRVSSTFLVCVFGASSIPSVINHGISVHHTLQLIRMFCVSSSTKFAACTQSFLVE